MYIYFGDKIENLRAFILYRVVMAVDICLATAQDGRNASGVPMAAILEATRVVGINPNSTQASDATTELVTRFTQCSSIMAATKGRFRVIVPATDLATDPAMDPAIVVATVPQSTEFNHTDDSVCQYSPKDLPSFDQQE